ncbi:hypothetical protein BS47DRAFT_1368802 [Hydnum rufescens UP504]|uniref:Uncharacterized protein n=1 Tax=Hydnum rufescens UP504 TaxID=1448309 RepID=A0A9P6AFU5_9AGAM|nr:hypothetical protein BS47DRAFT_1368802 [Hydnum rufescens UP504]
MYVSCPPPGVQTYSIEEIEELQDAVGMFERDEDPPPLDHPIWDSDLGYSQRMNYENWILHAREREKRTRQMHPPRNVDHPVPGATQCCIEGHEMAWRDTSNDDHKFTRTGYGAGRDWWDLILEESIASCGTLVKSMPEELQWWDCTNQRVLSRIKSRQSLPAPLPVLHCVAPGTGWSTFLGGCICLVCFSRSLACKIQFS